MISKSQFLQFLTDLKTTPVDVLSIERIVGFNESSSQSFKLKIVDVIQRILERSQKRG